MPERHVASQELGEPEFVGFGSEVPTRAIEDSMIACFQNQGLLFRKEVHMNCEDNQCWASPCWIQVDLLQIPQGP